MRQLPFKNLDPAWRDRIVRMANAEKAHGQDSLEWRRLVAEPWVKARPYAPQTETHCPHGHSHDAEVVGPVRHADRPHIRRQCRHCPNWWLEPVDAMP